MDFDDTFYAKEPNALLRPGITVSPSSRSVVEDGGSVDRHKSTTSDILIVDGVFDPHKTRKRGIHSEAIFNACMRRIVRKETIGWCTVQIFPCTEHLIDVYVYNGRVELHNGDIGSWKCFDNVFNYSSTIRSRVPDNSIFEAVCCNSDI